jgi:hypothetical protein
MVFYYNFIGYFLLDDQNKKVLSTSYYLGDLHEAFQSSNLEI